MVHQGQKSAKSDRPRRGRPSGKNRVPLSLEERRARNAQYEKERREENSSAMAELAREAGCDPEMVQADLLATVICFIKNGQEGKSVEDMRACNERLMAQIAECERRLGGAEEDISPSQGSKRKREDDESSSSSSDSSVQSKKYKTSPVEQAEPLPPQHAPEPRPAPVPSYEQTQQTGHGDATFGLPFAEDLGNVLEDMISTSSTDDLYPLESLDDMISLYL